jgi:hypothetical protein
LIAGKSCLKQPEKDGIQDKSSANIDSSIRNLFVSGFAGCAERILRRISAGCAVRVYKYVSDSEWFNESEFHICSRWG